MFLTLIILWLLLLILGYGCIFWSIKDQLHPHFSSFSEALYFAGTSLLTIGYGDFTAVTGGARFLSLAAGTSGLALLGLCFSAVFNLQNLLYQREVPVAVLGSRLQGKFSGLFMVLEHSRSNTVRIFAVRYSRMGKVVGHSCRKPSRFPSALLFSIHRSRRILD